MKIITMYRSFLLFFLALISTFSLSACNPTQLKSEAAQVSQLVLSDLGDPKTFNYALNQEATRIFGYIYEGLVEEDGLTGEVKPALAESWEIAPDNKQITFTMKEGLKWSDGKPLTVDDVDFTYNKIYLNKAIPTDTRDILRVGESGALPKVEKLDGRRIKFTVPEPFAPFLRNTGLPILPAHSLQKSVETKDKDGKPQFLSKLSVDTPLSEVIASGMFKLEEYATSQRVVFRRNPHYWRKDEQGKPLPNIERVVAAIVESTDTAVVQFRSGGIDILGVTPDIFSLLKKEEKRNNFKIYNNGPDTGTTFISFNLNRGSRKGKPLVDPIKSKWFNNVKFRQAVAYGIDRQRMINNIFRGLGANQDSPISVPSPYYLSPKEGLKTYEHNPEKAKELLTSAGFTYNNKNQLVDSEGNRVRFTLITNAENKIRVSMGAQIKQDLAAIGIQVDFNPIAFSTLVDQLSNTLNWECHLLGFTGGVEPNSGANVWAVDGGLHSFNQTPGEGQPPLQGREVADWEAEIGRLYIQGARELDEEKRKAIYAETQRLTQDNLPFIYLVNPLSQSAVRDRVENIKPSALGGVLWNLYELKVTK